MATSIRARQTKMLKQFTDHLWFRPLHRRVIVHFLISAWLGFELALADSAFMTAFAAVLSLFTAYVFFFYAPRVWRARAKANTENTE